MKYIVENKMLFGVPIIEYRVISGEPQPTIFFCHGINGCKEDVEEFAEHLATAGYNIISIDAYLHGERTESGFFLGDSEIERQYADIVITTGEDINILFENYYKSKPYVDTDNVFICGISMGGAVAFYSGTILNDIKGIVSVIGSPSFVDFLKYCADLENIEFSEEERNRLALFDPLLNYKNLKGKDILMINGKKDKRVPSEFSEDLFVKLKEEEYDYVELILYNIDHSVNKEMMEDVYKWLKNNTL